MGHWSSRSTGREWKGPDLYLSRNSTGPFAGLQFHLYRNLEVHVRLHQFAYASFREQDKRLDELVADLKAENTTEPEDFEEREALLVRKSHLRSFIRAEDEDLNRSIQTINRMLVVTLWALSEQYLGAIFKQLVSLRTGNAIESLTAPYRWDVFKTRYAAEGIALDTLHDHDLANECRILNNHIKHSPIVSEKLAIFPSFSTLLGQSLDEAPIDPQHYFNGVSNFLGSLLERANVLFGGCQHGAKPGSFPLPGPAR